jgi:hypothetical protein
LLSGVAKSEVKVGAQRDHHKQKKTFHKITKRTILEDQANRACGRVIFWHPEVELKNQSNRSVPPAL